MMYFRNTLLYLLKYRFLKIRKNVFKTNTEEQFFFRLKTFTYKVRLFYSSLYLKKARETWIISPLLSFRKAFDRKHFHTWANSFGTTLNVPSMKHWRQLSRIYRCLFVKKRSWWTRFWRPSKYRDVGKKISV
jgi:hypothetical protein